MCIPARYRYPYFAGSSGMSSPLARLGIPCRTCRNLPAPNSFWHRHNRKKTLSNTVHLCGKCIILASRIPSHRCRIHVRCRRSRPPTVRKRLSPDPFPPFPRRQPAQSLPSSPRESLPRPAPVFDPPDRRGPRPLLPSSPPTVCQMAPAVSCSTSRSTREKGLDSTRGWALVRRNEAGERTFAPKASGSIAGKPPDSKPAFITAYRGRKHVQAPREHKIIVPCRRLYAVRDIPTEER